MSRRTRDRTPSDRVSEMQRQMRFRRKLEETGGKITSFALNRDAVDALEHLVKEHGLTKTGAVTLALIYFAASKGARE